jgi:hypothetical protein
MAAGPLGTSYTSLVDTVTGSADYRSVTTLWRLSDPASPIALPTVTGDDDPLDGRSDLSNQGTFFTWTKSGRLFLVSTTGSQELSFPPGTAPPHTYRPEFLIRSSFFTSSLRLCDFASNATQVNKPRNFLLCHFPFRRASC